MSTPSNDYKRTEPDYTLAHAHGTVMIIAWMLFASTGILFARYGRLLRISGRVKILGELIWFQIHRLALCLAALATILGFLLIFSQAAGQWVSMSNSSIFAHSILGIIIVCCAQIQVWMALFRCHPESHFRFIYNWMHRLTGLLAFILSIPNIFIIVLIFPDYHNGFITILSLWTAWVVIIVIVFEIIEYQCRKSSILSADTRGKYEISNTNPTENVKMDGVDNSDIQIYNGIKTILFYIHIMVAICLAIPLIVLIWMQG